MAVNAPSGTEETQDQEAFHFFQVRPELLESGKKTTVLAQTDLVTATVFVADSGGETIVHAHHDIDQVYVVLAGECTFYSTEHEIVGVLQPFEGVLVPRNTVYWYEKTGDQNLVMLRTSAKDPTESSELVRLSGQLRQNQPVVVREGAFFGR